MSIVACPPVATPIRHTLPAVTCTAFCEHQNGHPNEVFEADQVCISPSERLTVGFGGAGVEVYVIGTATSDPLITVAAEDALHVVHDLTITEAERLLGILRRAVATARQHRAVTR